MGKIYYKKIIVGLIKKLFVANVVLKLLLEKVYIKVNV